MPNCERTDKVKEERGRHGTAVRERDYEEPTHPDRNELDAEEQVTTSTPSAWSVARRWIGVFRAWIGIALAVVEVILGFRLGFLLAGANPSNGFVDFIYDISGPLTDPFQGIVSNRSVDGGIFEPASIIAMLVYLVAGALLISLILAMRSGWPLMATGSFPAAPDTVNVSPTRTRLRHAYTQAALRPNLTGMASLLACVPEEELVRRAKLLDEAALSSIFDAYYPRVYNNSLLQLRDAQAAEDLASDVILRVLESITRYHPRGVPSYLPGYSG